MHDRRVGEMKIHRIQWQETITLRHEVLWPNERAEFCHVDGDERAWHFGGFIEDELVSVASVYRKNNSVRLRKFATATAFQGKGIGTKMLKHILEELAKSNIDHFWCDARESAMSFYERFGMGPEGGRFYKGDVPYVKMSLLLQ